MSGKFHEIENFLQHTPAPLQDIVFELRNIIVKAAPDAVEVIRWGGLSYFHEGRGELISAGICQIGIHEDSIRLDFIHGEFLPDPHGLLHGNQKAKRFVRIESYEAAPSLGTAPGVDHSLREVRSALAPNRGWEENGIT